MRNLVQTQSAVWCCCAVRRGLLQELVMGAHASAAVILFAWCINTHSLWQSFEVRSRKAAGAPRPHVCHAAQLSLACAGTRAHLRPDLPTSAPGFAPICAGTCPHLRRDWPTSAPGLGSHLPHLRQDWAHRRLPHLHRDRAHPCRICARTGLTPATSAPGPGSPLPHVHRGSWVAACTRTWHGDRPSSPIRYR